MKKDQPYQYVGSGHLQASAPVFNKISPTTTQTNLSQWKIKPKGKYFHNDVLWPVLPEEHDQDPAIMKKLFSVVEQVSAKSRFLAVRYDMHVLDYSADNRILDNFHMLLFKKLAQVYPKSFVSYAWVRERASIDPHHYHYLLMMDGNYIRYPNKLLAIVDDCWKQAGGNYVGWANNCYYFVTANDIETYTNLMIRVSYMGKRRTKESTKGIQHVGTGMRQPKMVSRPKAVQSTKPKAKEPSTASTYPDSGMLDKYFSGEEDLSHYEFHGENKLSTRYRPRWPAHRQNFLFETLITGISLSAYARKYRLNLKRVYANLRCVGGQSLKIIHWAWHRYRFLQDNCTLDNYIKNNRLSHKTAKKQLRRKPMSEDWRQHFDNYYTHFWPLGWTVADYCRSCELVPSTARRYLVDFPFIDLINPFLLKPWL
ncbi:inovirus-type Gp2 protein [Bacillus amyloliquefaciens]|nr:inovirus-type Gp2 protein [Bacillus amyloliquefaciens]